MIKIKILLAINKWEEVQYFVSLGIKIQKYSGYRNVSWVCEDIQASKWWGLFYIIIYKLFYIIIYTLHPGEVIHPCSWAGPWLMPCLCEVQGWWEAAPGWGASSCFPANLCLFCKPGEGCTGARRFQRSCFLCFYFLPLEVAAIIFAKEGGESRVVGKETC